MRIENFTDVSNERIREIIRFVRPSGISNFDVMVKNYSRVKCVNGYEIKKGGIGRGMAYRKGSSYHSTSNPFVVVSIVNNDQHFPYAWGAIGKNLSGGYIGSLLLSREEALVHILAHELRYLWQGNHPKEWRIFGSRGQMSERDVDAYAIRMTRAWRNKQREGG